MFLLNITDHYSDELLQSSAKKKKQARVQDEYQGRWFDQVFDIFCTQTESAKCEFVKDIRRLGCD